MQSGRRRVAKPYNAAATVRRREETLQWSVLAEAPQAAKLKRDEVVK
ncbi:hypothetical protein HMPREF0580_0783 [Mobiluncus mulieris ATCC 35239]|uniref:Uncharacterized protein n=2 Tax=Mobiluncus mulieris TaxID=2052 RepID=E0QPG8_9ACTO|nr:hypothetical protein HMPREF0580_0783 [Mobiluncus mulieris ATCC 35239]MBB5846791.1 hypothetical protein [Mobiluncus mulieris]STO16744.1 Uncharacterised protein [Mobiluncus mulieris]